MTHELVIGYLALILSITGLLIQAVQFWKEKVRQLKFSATIGHHDQWVDPPDQTGERSPRSVPCLAFTFINPGELSLYISIDSFESDSAGRINLSEFGLGAIVEPNKSVYEFTYGDPVATKLLAHGCGGTESGYFVVKDDFDNKYKSQKLRLGVSKLIDEGKKGR